MSEHDPELDALLAPLRAELDVEDALSPAARARVLASMQAQTRAVPLARARAHKLRSLYVGAPLLLAAAASFALLWRAPAPTVAAPALRVASTGAGALSWTDERGAARALRGGELLGAGELSVPEQGSAQLTTGTGVWIEAAARSRLAVAAPRERDQDVELRAGSVRCRVPPLGRGHAFSVQAASARVVVHGTDFSVALESAELARRDAPCVRVREGLVEVQQAGQGSVWLGPGQSWGCRALGQVTPVKRVAPVAEPIQPAPAAKARGLHRNARPSRAQRPPRISDSTLERENRLLASALSAERRGDRSAASALFAALLAQFPQSSLAPEARAGLARTHDAR